MADNYLPGPLRCLHLTHWCQLRRKRRIVPFIGPDSGVASLMALEEFGASSTSSKIDQEINEAAGLMFHMRHIVVSAVLLQGGCS